MTPEQFIWWLEGFLDGGADIDMDVRNTLREKLGQVGASPAPKQPVADKPRTPSSALEDHYFKGIGVGIATPGIASPLLSPGLTPAWEAGAYVDPSTTFLTNVSVTSKRDPIMAELSAAARACE